MESPDNQVTFNNEYRNSWDVFLSSGEIIW